MIIFDSPLMWPDEASSCLLAHYHKATAGQHVRLLLQGVLCMLLSNSLKTTAPTVCCGVVWHDIAVWLCNF